MAKIQSPQLGYNTNVRHKGKLFHIQTEDSGINRPHIITHLFADGGRILKSVKTSYADSLEEPDLPAFVRRRMQEQHKAMFVALRDGQYDAMVDFGEAPAAAAAPEAPPPPAPTTEARATVPPDQTEVAPARTAPPPRSTLAPAADLRATGRSSLRATGAREVPPIPSMRPPVIEDHPPSRPPVFSNSMRYTSPRVVAPHATQPAPRAESPVPTEALRVVERTLDEVILAFLSEELGA